MISLDKGQQVSLTQVGAAQLTRVRMGLGWDPARRAGLLGAFKVRPRPIDLDASCLLYDGDELVDQVWYGQLGSLDGSVRHLGDNQTGDGEGDDESIVIDLTVTPDWISTIIFVITSFSDHYFSAVEQAHCRLMDLGGKASTEVVRFDLSAAGEHSAMVMAKMTRTETGWSIQAIGEPSMAATIDDLAHEARAFL